MNREFYFAMKIVFTILAVVFLLATAIAFVSSNQMTALRACLAAVTFSGIAWFFETKEGGVEK